MTLGTRAPAMGMPSSRSTLAITAVLVVVALAAGVIVSEIRGVADSEDRFIDSDWGGPPTPEMLFAGSQMIVAGSVEAVDQQRVGLRSPADGEVRAHRDEELWHVRVAAVFRGDAVEGDLLEIRVATGIEVDAASGRPALDVPVDTVRPAESVEHVFFLVHLDDEGGEGLGLAGPASVAALEGGELRFLLPAAFEAELKEHPGFRAGPTGLGWDDAFDLDTLRDLERDIPAGIVDTYEEPKEVQRMVELAGAFDRLLGEASSFTSPAEAEQRAAELGLTGASIGNPDTCRKYEGVLSQQAGFDVSLQCE